MPQAPDGLVPGALALARRTSAMAAAAVVLVGVVALCGWAFDVEALKRVLPDLPSMKANTALAFVASGVSLWFLLPGRIETARARGGVLAVIALAIGLLTLLEYAGLDLGIDELLFADPASPAHPGRPSPITALAFVFTGASLL